MNIQVKHFMKIFLTHMWKSSFSSSTALKMISISSFSSPFSKITPNSSFSSFSSFSSQSGDHGWGPPTAITGVGTIKSPPNLYCIYFFQKIDFNHVFIYHRKRPNLVFLGRFFSFGGGGITDLYNFWGGHNGFILISSLPDLKNGTIKYTLKQTLS